MSNQNNELGNKINEDNQLSLELSKIEREYERKINDVVNEIIEKYDSAITKIKTRLEKKYQEIARTLKLRHDLKERLKELKLLLKTFRKEAKILTHNKQKELDDKIKLLSEERNREKSLITGETPFWKEKKEPEMQLNPDLY